MSWEIIILLNRYTILLLVSATGRYGQHLSEVSRDLATLTFDLGGHAACRCVGLSTLSGYKA